MRCIQRAHSRWTLGKTRCMVAVVPIVPGPTQTPGLSLPQENRVHFDPWPRAEAERGAKENKRPKEGEGNPGRVEVPGRRRGKAQPVLTDPAGVKG